MRLNAKFAILIVLGASLALVITSCSKGESKTPANRTISQVVKTVTVQTQQVGDVLEIPAKVQADPATLIHVYPPAGGRLLQVSVRLGDHVRKGQTIAIEQSSDVAQARADYSRAHAEADKTNRALERAKLLFDHKVLSEREYEQAEADYSEAKSELDRSAGRLQVLGVPIQGNSNEVALLAPRSGAVLDIGAAAGELSKSTDNANSIATIADLSTVWVVGDVYEKDLGSLKAG
jgi:cobalt-zinc-cadmium efflux system membrane fusion protein